MVHHGSPLRHMCGCDVSPHGMQVRWNAAKALAFAGSEQQAIGFTGLMAWKTMENLEVVESVLNHGKAQG